MHNKAPSSRLTAAEILVTLFRHNTPVKHLFDKLTKRYGLPANDRNLTKQLVYGVLRKKQNIDRILELISKTPIRKLEPFVHQALAVGLYQIFYLDRIPDSAAVNEAVESCKFHKVPKRLLGFVNGVLRQSARQKDLLMRKINTTNDGTQILNHPDWLIERWQENYGYHTTQQICAANTREPSLTLRINTNRVTPEKFHHTLNEAGINFCRGHYAEDALILTNFHGSPISIPGFDEGHLQIQDEAAQLATLLLQPFRKGGVYLDGCAGLGGKTTHLVQLSQKDDCIIHAVEPENFRRTKLQENITRMFPDMAPGSLTIHPCPMQNLTSPNQKGFDGILIDAPCSGTGVTGRHPDIRWNRSVGDLTKYQKTQLSLLTHASGMLASDGILVYATCSIEPEENQEVISTFLEENQDFELSDCSLYLPKGAAKLVRNRFFCPLPNENLDGFFGARLKRA